MKILKSVNRVPGGLMVVPLFIGMVLNTFFPDLLRIGGFTQALTGVGYPTVLGMYLFTVGTKMTFRAAPRMLLRGGGILVAKVGTATIFALTIAHYFGGSILGLSTLAVMVAMSDTNGGMFLALTSVMGSKDDSGTYVVQSVETGPFLTMLIFVGAGLAVIPWLTMLSVIAPILAGAILGNLDDDIKEFFGSHEPIIVPFMAFTLGQTINLRSVVTAGVPGVILGVTVVIVTGFVCILADKLLGGTGIAGAAASSTAGNSAAVPKAVAIADPNYLPVAEAATVQVAASVIVTAILTPLLTSWWYKRVLREQAANAIAGRPDPRMHQESASREEIDVAYYDSGVHDLDLILTLASGFTAALVFGYFTQRAGLSPIVGYLLAGTLVGPHTPGFVANAEIAEQLAEVGVILLMFGVGLQFHIEELLAVRGVAIPGAVAQSVVATLLGAAIAHWFGWSWAAGIVFGMALAVASTVVLIRVLADHRDLHTPTGHIAVGWLVVEDLFTVLALVLLPVLFSGSGSGSNIALALVVTALKVGALVSFTIVVGTRVIPYLLDRIAATGSRELFTLSVLTLALGIAVGSAAVFGVSMALGAFLAGLVVGRSDYSLRAASEALPMRDAFAVLFFVAVGMLLSPRYLFEAPGLILATLSVVMLGKPLIALVVVRLLGYPFKVALAIAVALAQIGEFSFILSSIGTDLRILPPEATNTLVAVSIVSIVCNPLLYRLVPRIEAWVNTHPRVQRWLNPPLVDAGGDRAARRPTDRRRRAIVIGYGPTGRTVVRLLKDNGIEPTVVELNMDTVRQLRQQGIDAVYGDAVQRDTLEGANSSNADTLVLTSAGMSSAAEVIRIARDLNPSVQVLARAQYLRDLPDLLKAGADQVFTGEGEVALSLTESILDRLGATAEQIDRERERAHRELFGSEPAAANAKS